MTENNAFVSRRDRRARKTGMAGRTTAAVLASAGLVIGTGVAANATDTTAEGRAASTVDVPAAALTVERASTQTASVVSAPAEVSLSFERPSFTSEAAPQPEPEPEPEPVVEATPASQQSQEQPASEQSSSDQSGSEQSSSQQSSGSNSGSEESSEGSSESSGESQSNSSEQQESAPEPSGSGSGSAVVSAAYSTLGTPHVMGGTTPGSGIDCSGMIQYAYAQAGISVPRTTHGMAGLPRVSSPQPGDIVLSNGNSHGGIYVGNGQVISTTASGGVRVHGLHDGWHNVTSYHRPG